MFKLTPFIFSPHLKKFLKGKQKTIIHIIHKI